MSHFPIHIPGTPIPQGSKSVTRRGILYEDNPRLKAWRAVMTANLIAWCGTWFGTWEPHDGPLLVDVTFTLPKPKTVKRDLPSVPPDTDKLQRALGDAMKVAGVITDDSRITTWYARKRYGTPGVTIHDIRKDSP